MSMKEDQIRKNKTSTDYKERVDDPRINEEDKHELQSSRSDSMIPERGENPALEDLQQRRAERQQAEEE